MKKITGKVRHLGLALILLTVTTLLVPGCRAGYVIRSAWYQGELLASRESFEEVRARPDVSPELLRGLERVEDIKLYGHEIGLKPTKAYQTVSLDWDRKMWNISACQPLSFEPVTWWFPVVGRVPYLGFFDEGDLERWKQKLEGEGLDVYQRRIGTYSTLGWFSDPLLPGMLDGTEYEVAKLVLHELAHATVWIRGSVSFNESFASFVGDVAAEGYVISRFGPDSPQLRKAHEDEEDAFLWRRLQRDLYERLDAVYKDKALSDDEKRQKKAEIFAAFPALVAAAPFHDGDWAVRAARKGTWNNARLIQFRTYNDRRPIFEALLEKNGGDLLAFMEDVRREAGKGDSPWKALEAATAAQRPTTSTP